MGPPEGEGQRGMEQKQEGQGGWLVSPLPGCLQPRRRGHWANDQLGTLGEMGQSFLDKRGFYQPIKIPLSFICYLLL